MPTLEELEALTKVPEQQTEPVVAAPTSVPVPAPLVSLQQLAAMTNPAMDTSGDQRSSLNTNLEWQEKFQPGSFYKGTSLSYEEGKAQAEKERFESLPFMERAKEAAGFPKDFQSEPLIGVGRGFVNPIIDTAQLPGHLAKTFQEADVFGDDGVQFDYSWDKPMTSLLFGVTDVLQKLQNEINEGVNPDRGVLEQFPEALGSAAAFLVGGAASGAKTVLGKSAVSAGMGAGMGATGQLEEALAYGASPEDQLLAAGGGALLGTTEGLPGFHFLKKLNKLGGGKILDKLNEFGLQGESTLIREGVKGALTEMLQEGGQTIGSNWIASDLVGYDPTRTLGENFWDSVITAGMVGSFMGGGIQMMRDTELNEAKKKLNDDYEAKMASGDVINALSTPGNGFGSFTPVQNLIDINKLLDDLNKHIDTKAELALQQLEARGESAESDMDSIADVDELAEAFGLPPDPMVQTPMQIPHDVMPEGGEGEKWMYAVGIDGPINRAVEKALPKNGANGEVELTVRQALLHTPVVTMPSRYEELYKEVQRHLKNNIDFRAEYLRDNNKEEVAKYDRRIKMLSLREKELSKKLNISNALLGHVKNYLAAFRTAFNPDIRLFVRDYGTRNDHEGVNGWFAGARHIWLDDTQRVPVGALFIKLEELVDEIYADGAQQNSVAFRNAKRKIFEVINHELGHSVFSKHMLETVQKIRDMEGDPVGQRQAYKQIVLLQNEYRNWIQEMSGQTQRGFIDNSFAFQRGASMLTRAKQFGKLDEVNEASMAEPFPTRTHEGAQVPLWADKEYYLSLDEFFAEMTARLATQGELADPAMTEFFKPVLEQYQKIFNTYPEFAKNEFGNNWKEFLQSRALSYKVREELEKVKANGSSNLWDGLRGGVDGLNPDNFAGLRHQLDRWNKGISLGLNLLQLEKTFGHVPQFGAYRNTTEAWAAYQRDFADKATQTLETWRGLGKKDAANLAAVFYHESETRKNLSPAALSRELSGEALQVYQQVREQLNRVLDEMQITALREANREHANNSEKLALAQKEITDEFTQLKDSGYFPYIRFGDWTITARARKSGTYLGNSFKEGELITFQAFESRKERDQEYTKLRNELGSAAAVSAGKMRESEYTVQGMPRSILLALKNRLMADNQMTSEVEKAIEQSLEANAPFKNFRSHFKKKQGIHGYSEDAFRTFAHYIRAAAGNISRVRYAGEMRESIDSMQGDVKTITEIGGNATARQEMVHWLRRHFDYIMNPASEFAALRGVGFVAYLGFNIKSAFVNTTQMLTTTYPYLAARYGDVNAVSHLGKAGAWLKKWVFKKEDFFNAKPNSHEQRIAELVARGQSEGWLDQSLATELAIAASENSLDRSLYLPGYKRWWHNFSRWSALPFHLVEKTNRYVTAIAAYNLSYEENGSHEKSVLAAKLANQQTHFENARWNRPEFLRGKKSAALLFVNFIQNQLYFVSQDPGAVRYFCVMLLLAGVMGLPGADDLVDVVEAGITKLNKELGMKNPKVQIRLEMRKFLDELGANPDLVMHGTSQDSFGLGQVGELTGIPIPRFDLSRSIGMGNIIPGTELPNMILNGGKPGDVAMEAFSQAAGASGNLVEDYYRALFSNDPSDWKKAEKLLPLMSMRSLSKAARYFAEGKERTANGVVIADFTPYDVRVGLEIAGQGLGFPIREVQQGWEREIAVRDATQFYKTWQMGIQRNLNIAYLQEDREAIADAMDNLRRYNESVPLPEMGIKAKDAKQAVRQFLKSQMKAGMGFAAQKKYERLSRSIEEAFPDPHGDSVRKNEVGSP